MMEEFKVGQMVHIRSGKMHGWYKAEEGTKPHAYYTLKVHDDGIIQHFDDRGLLKIDDIFPQVFHTDEAGNSLPEIKREIDWEKVEKGAETGKGYWVFLAYHFDLIYLAHYLTSDTMGCPVGTVELTGIIPDSWYKEVSE